MNPGTDRERSFSLGSGSGSSTDGGRRDRPSVAPKLRSVAVLALVVGAGIAYNRMRSRRRSRVAAEQESGGRFARLRSR